jgi:hypothetical protein
MTMPELAMRWPHAPTHQLSENGTYFVTAGTYLKLVEQGSIEKRRSTAALQNASESEG